MFEVLHLIKGRQLYSPCSFFSRVETNFQFCFLFWGKKIQGFVALGTGGVPVPPLRYPK